MRTIRFSASHWILPSALLIFRTPSTIVELVALVVISDALQLSLASTSTSTSTTTLVYCAFESH
jgi:hypothetical protein